MLTLCCGPAKFRMFKYSYQVGENMPKRTATILYNKTTNKMVTVQDGKDGISLTLQVRLDSSTSIYIISMLN